MKNLLSALWNEENGQDMVEYSLLVGFMALMGAGVLTGLRGQMVGTWSTINASFASAAS